MFDLGAFLKISLPTAAALLPIVLALVTWLGQVGLKDKGLLVASMVSGLLLGGGAMYFQQPPKDAAGWFAVALFGLIVGLGASGVYDVGKQVALKSMTKALNTPYKPE